MLRPARAWRPLGNFPALRGRPDEEWMRAWLRAEIVNALEMLPKEQRDVFVMHKLEGKTFGGNGDRNRSEYEHALVSQAIRRAIFT
jgi:sigma-70-like protein